MSDFKKMAEDLLVDCDRNGGRVERVRQRLVAVHNAALEEAAKVHEPSCSCPEPCDDYFVWPSACHKKAASVIRALKGTGT